MIILFDVPAIPVAQPRQRHRIAAGSGKQWVQNYTPSKSPANEFKATVKMALAASYRGEPLTGPLSMWISCVFPSKSKYRRVKPTKPDCDNLAKCVCDALNGLAYRDDGQIVSLTVQKFHAARDEQPHVSVKIESIVDP